MLNFFKKLLPNFEKRRLLNQCEVLRENISSVLLPYVNQVIEFTQTTGLRETTSKTGITLQKTLRRRLDRVLQNSDKVNYATLISAVLTQLDAKVQLLYKFVDDNFNQEVSTSGINYKQLHIMRLIDLGNFFVNYTIKVLDQISYEEAQTAAIRTENSLTPAEIKWLELNLPTYIELAAIFTEKEMDFARMIEETAQVNVVESEELAEASGLNTDPHKLGFMPVIGDVILFVNEQVVLYENNRYEANKTRLKVFQLRLLAMKEHYEKTQSNLSDEEKAKLIKGIDYWTKKIKDLEYKIKKHEDKVK